MDFLLEPMELGSEFEKFLEPLQTKVTCDVGYGCETGTVETDAAPSDS